MSAPGPTILISGLAPKTFIGLDLLSFTSTPNFHGVKDLTDGVHFLYTGTSESFSLRSGEWLYVGDAHASAHAGDAQSAQGQAGGQIVRTSTSHSHSQRRPDVRLRRWDRETETLRPFRAAGTEEVQEGLQLRANLGQIAQSGGLLSYRDAMHSGKSGAPANGARSDGQCGGTGSGHGSDGSEGIQSADWARLAGHIAPSTLTRILGDPTLDSDGCPSWTLSSGSSALRDAEEVPGLTRSEVAQHLEGQDKELHFTPIDLKQTWRAGAVGRERTEAAQDRSWYLGSLIAKLEGRDEDDSGAAVREQAGALTEGERALLGEMQLAFLMTLTLMNYSCMEQWKRILSLLFSCRKALMDRGAFYVEAIAVLILQLRHCDDVEGGLFEVADEGNNFLRRVLSGFTDIVDGLDADADVAEVRASAERLRLAAEELFQWELRKQFTVRRGILHLEDGEEVEMDVGDVEEDEESGEYAPVVVDLDESRFQ
ncbi:hypothetical protein KEM52_001273 [Ascosphaera acerosa]|nr:hypothetical protein KEM52_001273 [Ascosphaera acerosa]